MSAQFSTRRHVMGLKRSLRSRSTPSWLKPSIQGLLDRLEKKQILRKGETTVAETNSRANGDSQREMAELAAREREVRKREFDALVMKAGIDDAELARLKVLASLIADSYCERLEELLDAEEGSTNATRRPSQSNREGRESSSAGTRRRFFI
jgi:hypothetical protein